MNKHTPGPWTVYPTTELVDNRGTEGVTGYNIESESGEIVGMEGIEFWKENAEANANLIASAPDLLEALETALHDSGCDGDLCAHWWHEKARRAIAKAKGE